MKHSLLLVSLMIIAGCQNVSEKDYLDPSLPIDDRVEILLNRMTLEEKVGQMCQYTGTASLENPSQVKNVDEQVQYTLELGERASLVKEGKIGSFLKVPSYKEANFLQVLAKESRLKIPLLIATDAIHGHGMYGPPATIFPTPIGIASSFEEDVAQKIAKYTAREMRATGYHWTFSPNIEIARDARWGRFGETFGEDPLLVTKMGVAMIDGYQGSDFSEPDEVLACAKHFVAGGIAYNGLNGAAADISERTLHEIFFPPFRKSIEAGVYTLMPAHNEINGIPCHAHKEYLTELIREQWGFTGFFISDWMDIERLMEIHHIVENHQEAAEISVNAGLDMHMHGPGFYEHVLSLIKEEKIPIERINEAVSKILKAKFQLGLFENPYIDSSKIKDVVLSKEHLEYALEAARKSIVLLKNKDNILPLQKGNCSLFITGPLANHQGILGDWSRPLPDENLITLLEGIEEIAGSPNRIDYLACNEIDEITPNLITEAGRRAASADFAILAVGENPIRFSPHKTIGENLDRESLELSGNQTELIRSVVNSGTPVIIVMINGGPISSDWLVENTSAIIEAWEPGMMGGKAVAEVLFGEYNPGGRLPVTIPRSTGHIQNFYNHKPSSFHRGRFKNGKTSPLFEFGYGLSYTEFEYTNLEISDTLGMDDNLDFSFSIRNAGQMAGDEVILIFLNDKISSYTTAVKKLIAFQRIHLIVGEKKTLHFTIENSDLSLLNKDMIPQVEAGEFELIIGLDQLSKSIWLH